MNKNVSLGFFLSSILTHLLSYQPQQQPATGNSMRWWCGEAETFIF